MSRTIALTMWASSRLSASLIRIPFSAPLPIPTMIAVGVAKPKAHGQAITNTETMANNACVIAFSPPTIIQMPKVTDEMVITTGTKIPAILSTSFWTGGLLPCACCTILMIRASIVSPPTFWATKTKEPFWLIVPANTNPAFSFSTGNDSPVIVLSSINEEPEMISPSTGILSPGFTSNLSPILTWEICISTICPSSPTTFTIEGCNPISFLSADEVLDFALSSRSLPKRIKAITTADASK